MNPDDNSATEGEEDDEEEREEMMRTAGRSAGLGGEEGNGVETH